MEVPRGGVTLLIAAPALNTRSGSSAGVAVTAGPDTMARTKTEATTAVEAAGRISLTNRIKERYLPMTQDPLIAAVLCQWTRSEEHTSELQSRGHLVCRLLLEKKK